MTKADDNKRKPFGTFTAALLAGSGLSAQGHGHLEKPTEPAIKISAPRDKIAADASYNAPAATTAAPLTPLAPDGIPDPKALLLFGAGMVAVSRFARRRPATTPTDDNSRTR